MSNLPLPCLKENALCKVNIPFASAAIYLTALTQPEVEVVLQVSRALFDGVEDEVGIPGVKSPMQVLRNGHQVKVLHPPHLEARLLSGPLKLCVLSCHPACRKITNLRFSDFLLYRPTGRTDWDSLFVRCLLWRI